MTVTITLKSALLAIIAVLAIILLIYLILLVKKLIASLKQVDAILADTKAITEVASDRVQQVDGIVEGIGDTVGQVVDAIRGNQKSVAAVTHIIDASSSLINLFRKKGSKETGENTPEKKTKK